MTYVGVLFATAALAAVVAVLTIAWKVLLAVATIQEMHEEDDGVPPSPHAR